MILYQHQYVVQQHCSSEDWEHELMSSLLMCLNTGVVIFRLAHSQYLQTHG
jgi:hypothetical protein